MDFKLKPASGIVVIASVNLGPLQVHVNTSLAAPSKEVVGMLCRQHDKPKSFQNRSNCNHNKLSGHNLQFRFSICSKHLRARKTDKEINR